MLYLLHSKKWEVSFLFLCLGARILEHPWANLDLVLTCGTFLISHWFLYWKSILLSLLFLLRSIVANYIFVTTYYFSNMFAYKYINNLSSVQLLSQIQLLVTPWIAACQANRSITSSWSVLKLMSIESVMPSNHLITVVLFSSCLQSFPASESFQMSQFFTSGVQTCQVFSKASARLLPWIHAVESEL